MVYRKGVMDYSAVKLLKRTASMGIFAGSGGLRQSSNE